MTEFIAYEWSHVRDLQQATARFKVLSNISWNLLTISYLFLIVCHSRRFVLVWAHPATNFGGIRYIWGRVIVFHRCVCQITCTGPDNVLPDTVNCTIKILWRARMSFYSHNVFNYTFIYLFIGTYWHSTQQQCVYITLSSGHQGTRRGDSSCQEFGEF